MENNPELPGLERTHIERLQMIDERLSANALKIGQLMVENELLRQERTEVLKKRLSEQGIRGLGYNIRGDK